MENFRENPSEMPLLAGPAAIKIKVTSPRGPFTNKNANASLPDTHCCLVNTGTRSVVITRLIFDPLQRTETGVTAESNLAVEATGMVIAPGESTNVKISGYVPAAPAAYVSTLRVTLLEGAQLCIHVEFNVATRIAWGFACMAFGLSLMGIINLLDSESGLQGELRRALIARQDFHEFLQQAPPPQSRIAAVANIDHEFDAAIEILQNSRKLSFVDNRHADAQEHLITAAELSAELRTDLSQKPRGSIEVDGLAQEWSRLKEHFDTLNKQFLAPAQQLSPLTQGPGSLEQRLAVFDRWAAERLLRISIRYYAFEFDYQVNHVHLLYAAGRDQDAVNQAVQVRRRMQRAANFVNSMAQFQTFLEQESANNLAIVAKIRHYLAADKIAPARRNSILQSLNQAALSLAGPLSLNVRPKVSRLIEEARTDTLLAESEATQAAAKIAAAQEEKEDSLDSINAVGSEGATLKHGADGKTDPTEKMAWLQRLAAAWRKRLATFPDPNPPALLAELGAFETAIESTDIEEIRVHNGKLFELWKDYSTHRAQSLIHKAFAPFCLRIREETLISLEATQQTMARLEGNPDTLKWEGALDNLRMRISSTPNLEEQMPSNCLEIMNDIGRNAFNLSNEITSAMWSATILPDVTKHELAADFSSILTPEALQDLISDVRPLRIDVITPRDELYVGRRIAFRIGNLAPVWGAGVSLTIDFGDGRKPQVISAEELRKNPSITHVYADAKTLNLSVAAGLAFNSETMQPVRKALGEGTLAQFTISPSPISAARQLADNFFNARFGLALLIAGLLYFWRYQSRNTLFGAKAFDYAEAFVLGFSVSLAVNELPQKLVELFKDGGRIL